MIPRRKGTILVVEDDQATRESIKHFLEEEGFDVAVAENGEVALRYLRQVAERPRLILLDMLMPVLDGPGFLEERARGAAAWTDIPVIAMSVMRVPPEGVLEHVDHFIKRPFAINELLDAVRPYF